VTIRDEGLLACTLEYRNNQLKSRKRLKQWAPSITQYLSKLITEPSTLRVIYGNRAVANVPKLQKLMRHVCAKGFEHHVVMTQLHSAASLNEAFGNYFGWEVYNHGA
jgi:hypothetical protein